MLELTFVGGKDPIVFTSDRAVSVIETRQFVRRLVPVFTNSSLGAELKKIGFTSLKLRLRREGFADVGRTIDFGAH